MPPKSEPTPNELTLAKQSDEVRNELKAKKGSDAAGKVPKDGLQKEIREVVKEEVKRRGSMAGKKPNLDFYDNRRDVKSGPGDTNPPHSGKFGTTYHDDREHN